MPVEDLELEFEDEELKKEGADDSVHVDVDLTFSASADQLGLEAQESSLNELKLIQNNHSESHQAGQAESHKGKALSKEEIKHLKSEVIALKSKIKQVETQAQVKVALAQAKQAYMVEVISDAKVLDLQISQQLMKIYSRSPGVKPQAQIVKKLLNDYLKKLSKL